MHIDSFIGSFNPIYDTEEVLSRLIKVITANSLEEYISDNRELISCFVQNGYSFRPTSDISQEVVVNFYSFFSKLTPMKRKVVLDNIYSRLGKIKIRVDDDDLPF